jgi:O-antigen ligase
LDLFARYPLTRYLATSSAGLLLGAMMVYVSMQTAPMVTIAVPVAAFGAFLLLRFPRWCFLLTVAVVPIERLGRLTDDSSAYTISLMRIMGILALGSFLLHALVRRWRICGDGALFLYAVYWVLGLVTLGYTTDPINNVRTSGAMLGNLLFFFLVINMVRDWKLAKNAIQVWLAVSVVIGLYTMYNWHFGSQVDDASLGTTGTRFSVVHADTSEWSNLPTVKRALGPTSHSAVYAINLVLTLPFFFYLLRTRLSQLWRAAVIAGLGIIIYNIFLANTRAAILLTAFVLVLAAFRRMYTVRPAALAALALAALASLPLLPDSIYERVLNPENYTYEHSGTLQTRLQYWEAGLRVASDNWLTGIGLGNRLALPQYTTLYEESATVHNEYLETFMELGVVGWLVFCSFLVVIYRYASKTAARFARSSATEEQYWFLVAAQISMIATLLYGLQVDVFHFPLKGWWLVAGISAALYRMTQASAASNSTSLRNTQVPA